LKVDQQRVRDFLMEFKLIVEEGRGLDVIPRKENLELLAATGVLTEQLRRDVILGLSATDYCDGPLANEVPGHKGGIWIFGASVGGEETYIKLTIEPVKDENGAIVKLAKCLSFHPADRVLEYPFRAKGESE